jgi:iron complex outermembrane receptor protein
MEMKGAFTSIIMLLLFCFATQAQDTEVRGIVKDQDGNVLPGVNVLVMGTSNGTAVNNQGKFFLKVPKDSVTLLFALIGYKKIIHTIRTDEGVQYEVVVTMVSDAPRYRRLESKLELLPGAKD